MADWVVYDAGAAASTLPPSLATAYAAWLTADVRAERLGLLVSGVVSDFRKAVAADADATGKLNADSVPVSCLRHAANVVWYTLAQEMGVDPEPYRTGWQDGVAPRLPSDVFVVVRVEERGGDPSKPGPKRAEIAPAGLPAAAS